MPRPVLMRNTGPPPLMSPVTIGAREKPTDCPCIYEKSETTCRTPPVSLVAITEILRLDGMKTVMSPDVAISEESWSVIPDNSSARIFPIAVDTFIGPDIPLSRTAP